MAGGHHEMLSRSVVTNPDWPPGPHSSEMEAKMHYITTLQSTTNPTSFNTRDLYICQWWEHALNGIVSTLSVNVPLPWLPFSSPAWIRNATGNSKGLSLCHNITTLIEFIFIQHLSSISRSLWDSKLAKEGKVFDFVVCTFELIAVLISVWSGTQNINHCFPFVSWSSIHGISWIQ